LAEVFPKNFSPYIVKKSKTSDEVCGPGIFRIILSNAG
jgi:hypothetical protein